MKRITSVEFGFENLESVIVKSFQIGSCLIEGISKKIRRVAVNCITEYNGAQTVVMELLLGAEKDILDKIKDSQITSITVKYSDGDENEYYVPYESLNEELGAHNIHQKTYLSSLGNLYLVIDEKQDIDSFFDKEEINDREYMADYATDLA